MGVLSLRGMKSPAQQMASTAYEQRLQRTYWQLSAAINTTTTYSLVILHALSPAQRSVTIFIPCSELLLSEV